jgi:hypothetical protein
MSYDLMNRRDNVTNHHSSVVDSIQTIKNYLAIGAPPQKMNRLSSLTTTHANDCRSRLRLLRKILHNPRRLLSQASWLPNRPR